MTMRVAKLPSNIDIMVPAQRGVIVLEHIGMVAQTRDAQCFCRRRDGAGVAVGTSPKQPLQIPMAA